MPFRLGYPIEVWITLSSVKDNITSYDTDTANGLRDAGGEIGNVEGHNGAHASTLPSSKLDEIRFDASRM